MGFTTTWTIFNQTENGKANWILKRYQVHAPIFGNVIDWTFDNITVGLQDAAEFEPWDGCPPIKKPKTYLVSGYVRSAVSNEPLPKQHVVLSRAGADDVSNTTDTNGIYWFHQVIGGPVNVSATNNSAYADTSISLNVTEDIGAGTTADIFVSPTQPANQFRMILTWGYMPQDLDLHAWDGSCEIAYFNRQCSDGSLDHDTRTGYGPETITLGLARGNTDRFHLFVNQYSSQGTLQTSNARVVVFVGNNKTLDLAIPTDSGASSDTWWDVGVFSAETGAVTQLINKIQANKPTPP